MNKVILIGRVGKDPEVRRLDSGATVATFSLATSKKWTDKAGNKQEKTEWHNIVCWRTLAEVAEKYVTKGSQLAIEGEINYEEYEKDGVKRYSTKITADSFEMIGSRPAGEGNTDQGSRQPATTTRPAVAKAADDDLPF